MKDEEDGGVRLSRGLGVQARGQKVYVAQEARALRSREFIRGTVRSDALDPSEEQRRRIAPT